MMHLGNGDMENHQKLLVMLIPSRLLVTVKLIEF